MLRPPDDDYKIGLEVFLTAMKLNELGISTIPLAPSSKKPPKGFRWKQFQNRVPTPEEIQCWHDGNDYFGLAIVLGAVSGGLMVRDFDKPGSYERFRDRNPEVCRSLPAVATPRGAHLYFRAESTRTVKLGDGELRGDGAYVAAPPSIHPDGVAYRWFRPLMGLPPFVDSRIFTGYRKRPDGPTETSREGKREGAEDSYILLCPTTSVDAAIRSTLPGRYGTRNECLLSFCRALRGIFPDAPADGMLSHVEAWHRQALPTIRTKDFGTTWREFRSAFPKTSRGGSGPTWAEAVATANEIDVPSWAGDHDQRLIRLITGLHQTHGGASFPLGCRQVQKEIGVSRMTASRMLRRLVDDEVLEITNDEIEIGKKAFEYRLIAHQRRQEP